jgi:hypothetical protein
MASTVTVSTAIAAPAASSDTALRKAAAAATSAALNADSTAAYGYLSARCQKTTSTSRFAGTLLIASAMAEGIEKVKLKDLHVSRVETRAVTADRGQARVFLSTKNGGAAVLNTDPSWAVWVRERGAWHTTDCGGGSSSTADAEARAEYLASVNFAKMPTTVTMDDQIGQSLSIGSSFTGKYTVTLVGSRDFGPTITQAPDQYGYGGRTATAKGHFVALQYKLENGTNGPIDPDSAFGDEASITDGRATWQATADPYASTIVEALTGTPPTATDEIGAGFDTTTWVTFDVPLDVTPVGVVLGYDTNSPITLQLPKAMS